MVTSQAIKDKVRWSQESSKQDVGPFPEQSKLILSHTCHQSSLEMRVCLFVNYI